MKTLGKILNSYAPGKSIILARKHIGNGAEMDSSARLCLTQAIEQFDNGEYLAANKWAAKSLSHSVGIFHYDYKFAESFGTF